MTDKELLPQWAAEIRERAKWQPIETAPKDGLAIFIGHPECARVAYWQDEDWIDLDRGTSLTCYFTPTHWQQLIKPPILKELEEK